MMAVLWPETSYLEFCSDVASPAFQRLGPIVGGRIPAGESGRRVARGIMGDAILDQGIGVPGGNAQFEFMGSHVAAGETIIERCKRATGGVYPRTALPVFGVQGGDKAAGKSFKQLGCVCNTLRLASAGPGEPVIVNLDWLTSNHIRNAGAITPSVVGREAKIAKTTVLGGHVKIKEEGGAFAAMRVQTIEATLTNNPISDTSLNAGDDTDPGDELFFPPGFLPGDEVVTCALTLEEQIDYDQFSGGGWLYFEVEWKFSTSDRDYTLTLGPFYPDDDGVDFKIEGATLFAANYESKTDTEAWALVAA